MKGYTITVTGEGDVAEIDFRDRFVTETILAVIDELKSSADADLRRGVVWDLRQADLSDLTIGIMRDVFRSKNQGIPRRPLRIACVVSNPTDAHIIKLWAEGFDDTRPYARRWFFDMEEALAWVRSTESGQRAPAPPEQAAD